MATAKHTIHHVLIVDRSSSMSSVRDVTISGFNENLITIRNEKLDDGVEQHVSLVTFASGGDQQVPVWRKPITDVKDFNAESYVPCGSTALYDAIGSTVSRLRDELAEDLKNQDANVIVTVFTDGGENDSKSWTGSKVKTLIDELEASRMWTFSFMGCNRDSLKEADTLGIKNVFNYDQSVGGTADAFKKLSSSRSCYTQAVSSNVRFNKGRDWEAYSQTSALLQNDFFTNDEKQPEQKPDDPKQGGDSENSNS